MARERTTKKITVTLRRPRSWAGCWPPPPARRGRGAPRPPPVRELWPPAWTWTSCPDYLAPKNAAASAAGRQRAQGDSTQCRVEEDRGVGVQLAAADVGVLEELRLAHQVGLGPVGEAHLVVEDGGVGAPPGVWRHPPQPGPVADPTQAAADVGRPPVGGVPAAAGDGEHR